MLEWSHTLAIEGVVPGVVKGYEFDIELQHGAVPNRAQLPKLSPKELEKESYHVDKSAAMGHLRVPTDEQKLDMGYQNT